MVLETSDQRPVMDMRLTAVSVGFRGGRHQYFLQLPHDEEGRAHLPQRQLEKILDSLGVRRGDTYTVS